jgi:hypothetical protein
LSISAHPHDTHEGGGRDADDTREGARADADDADHDDTVSPDVAAAGGGGLGVTLMSRTSVPAVILTTRILVAGLMGCITTIAAPRPSFPVARLESAASGCWATARPTDRGTDQSWRAPGEDF